MRRPAPPPLILLCAGAATDRAADARHGFEAPVASSLASLLSRAQVIADHSLTGDPIAESADDQWLRAQFDVPPDTAWMALGGLTHGLRRPLWQLTPCHLHLGIDHAMLIDPSSTPLTLDEARALAFTAQEAFSARGLELRVLDSMRWFVQGPVWPLITWPWTMASGRHIAPYLPHGSAARDWRRLLTEVQMLWHEHPVNEARALAGQRSINALWLNGFLGSTPPASTGRVLSDEPTLRDAAQACGWQAEPLAAEPLAASPKPLADPALPTLVDLGLWRQPRRLGDLAGWHQAWTRSDHWVDTHHEALTMAARTGRLRVVLTGERRILDLGTARRSPWRWWSRLPAGELFAARASA